MENRYWDTEHFIKEEGCMESCSINEGVCPHGMDCDLESEQELDCMTIAKAHKEQQIIDRIDKIEKGDNKYVHNNK
jgi:hypothetical protein